MKYLRIFIILSVILLNHSCGTIKEGFKNQKKNSSDEFLVEKKSPLVMPPDYSELPEPNSENNQTQTKENSIKNLVTNEQKITNSSNMESSESRDIEESLLDKIKNN